MGIIFGILCLAIIGRVLLQTARGGGRGRGQNPLPLLGLLLLVIGYIGVFFGRLIQAAVSRQREFLADASSVQFTRNPGGITGALKKIGGLGETGSRLEPRACRGTVLTCFLATASANRSSACSKPIRRSRNASAFLTRISTGNFPAFVTTGATGRLKKFPNRNAQPMPNIFGTVLGGAILASGDAEKPPVIRSHSVLPNLGNPTPLHLKYAEQLRDSLPDSVKAAAREPLDAVALIYAMLLSPDETTRTTQLAELAKRVDPAIQEKTIALFPDVSTAATHAHLPIINLALGALRQLTRGAVQSIFADAPMAHRKRRQN